jgi:electron transport complex protein RnfD
VTDRKVVLFQKPQINISIPTAARMWLVFCCVFLCVIQSALSDGGASLIAALVALCTAVLTELLLTWRKSGFDKIKDGSAAAAAVVFSILLPNHIHPVYAALGAFFAIAVVKQSFGGLGSNWLNPALGGWLFLRFSWPPAFAPAPADAAPSFDAAASFLNNTIFSLTGSELPSGYLDLLFLKTPGIIADRGLFALLAGTIIITAFRISRCWASAVFLAIFCFLTRFAADVRVSGQYWNGDMLYGLFSGGVVAAAFILAAEPASGAKSKPGVLAAAFLTAALSWFFRYRCNDYYGCFTALAVVNCLTPVIRLCEEKLLFSGGMFSGGQV